MNIKRQKIFSEIKFPAGSNQLIIIIIEFYIDSIANQMINMMLMMKNVLSYI